MSESKSGSDDSSSSSSDSSSDSSIPSQNSEVDDNNNKTRAKSAEDDDSSASSSSSEEEEQQQQPQQQEGYMFNGNTYPTYQQMVAAKQERNRQVLERTTSEISLMLGSEYGSSSKASSKKKKPPSKKNKQSGPPRRNPKRKARSPSSSSISTSSHQEDTPRKRARSIGSRNSINSSSGGGGSISASGKVPSDVFMDNESIATQSSIDKNETLLQPYNRLVKDICIQTEQILVNGKRIQHRERLWQEFRRRNGGDRLNRSKIKQAREEEDDDDMSTHEDITSTVDWKLFHSSMTAGSLTQGNGGNIGKKNRQDRDTDVEMIVNTKLSSFLDDEDDIDIPEEYLAAEGIDTHTTQQQLPETLPINNSVKYNNIIRERNTNYTSKGIDRYWNEQYGDGVDHDLFVEKCCNGSCTDTSTAGDGLDNGNTGTITDTQNGDLVEERYTDSLLQRCWDRAVHAASSTLAVSLSDETEEGGVEGAVKTEENDTPLPNQKDIDSALHQKTRDAVDGILDTLLAKDSSLRLMLEDPKLKQQVDWCDVLDCLKAATEKQEKIDERALGQSMIKSLSIRLIERYRIEMN